MSGDVHQRLILCMFKIKDVIEITYGNKLKITSQFHSNDVQKQRHFGQIIIKKVEFVKSKKTIFRITYQ